MSTELLDMALTDGALFIDNTTLERYNNCPVQYEYASLRKRTAAAPQSALTFGGAIHEALAVRYSSDPHLKNVDTPEIMIATFGKALEGRPIAEDDYRNYEYGVALLRKYNAQYEHEDFEVLTAPGGAPFVEQPFAIPLGVIHRGPPCADIPVIYTGKIDLVVQMNNEAGYWVLDHKTNSIVGDSFYAQQAMSAQQEGYNYACWRVLKKAPLGFIINMLATRRVTRTGAGIEFNRQRVYLSKERLNEWWDNTLLLCEELIWNLSRGTLPRRKAHCVGKYGRCQYYDVCSLPIEQRRILLSSGLFTDNTWSPLNATSNQS